MRFERVTILSALHTGPLPATSGQSAARRGLVSSSAFTHSSSIIACSAMSATSTTKCLRPVTRHHTTSCRLTTVLLPSPRGAASAVRVPGAPSMRGGSRS